MTHTARSLTSKHSTERNDCEVNCWYTYSPWSSFCVTETQRV